MSRKSVFALVSILLLTGILLTACGKGSKSKEVRQSLAEQGYVITAVENFGDDANVIYLEKDGEAYVGTVDDQFNWLMEPTDSFEELVFHEGLAAVAVPEDREMILVNDQNALKWGFVNTKGEWVIEPIYREVHPFTNGVAIVKTIEEDRDDFMHSRLIVINSKGEEIGELHEKHIHTENIDNYVTVFTGNHAYTDEGFFDKSGKFTPMELSIDEYVSFNDKRFENDGRNNVEVYAKNLKGEVLNNFKTEDDRIRVPDAFHVSQNVIKHMAQNNVLLINGQETKYLVDASSMNLLLRGNIDTELGDGLLFIEDVTDSDIQDNGSKTGTFFDYNGKKVATVRDMVGPLLEDRYFVLGNEYYKLVDINGNVLIDESKKITEVEVANYDQDTQNPFKKMVKVKFREDANDTEPKDALLNVETLQLAKINELLNYQTIVK